MKGLVSIRGFFYIKRHINAESYMYKVTKIEHTLVHIFSSLLCMYRNIFRWIVAVRQSTRNLVW